MSAPARPPTAADAALIAEVKLLGVDVAVGKLRRWRSAQLIPTPIRAKAQGRGAGRASLSYPPGTADLVLFIERTLKKHRKLDDIPLWLFLCNRPVNPGLWRAEFRNRIIRGLAHLDEDEVFDRVDHLLSRGGIPGEHALKAVLKERIPGPDGNVFGTLFGIASQAFSGELISEYKTSLVEFGYLLGMDFETRNDWIETQIQTVDVAQPLEAFDTLTDAQLEHARDTWAILLNWIATIKDDPQYGELIRPIDDYLAQASAEEHIIGVWLIAQWETVLKDEFRDGLDPNWRNHLAPYPG